MFQVPVNPDVGVTFANVLRAILRHDPDKILVGEIRDYETAEIAVQSSLTGHMVFSTLHTNDAPSAITRLRDMGVPAFLITATVEAILAQRLVRRICSECRTQFAPSDELLMELPLAPRHESCPEPVRLSAQDEDFEAASARRENPFAQLGKLRTGKH